jgi:TRAP-type mannitol/chloroaromatic compound transport system permease large subunit
LRSTADRGQTTFLSPPVATAAYYLKAVAPDWTFTDIHWGMAEFMVLQLIGLLLVMLFPGVALWVPPLALREVSAAARPGGVALSGV